MRAAWAGVAARRLDAPRRRIQFGESIPVEVAVKLNGLSPDDVRVELLLSRARCARRRPCSTATSCCPPGSWTRASSASRSSSSRGCRGKLDYRIRIYPRHELLTHPFELGLMCWV